MGYALGARFVEVQPLIAYGPATQPLCLTAGELALARRQITAARAALPGLQMMPAAALTPNGNRCRRPLHAAYVTVEGFLTPCCTTNDASLFGHANLAEAGFDALWQSDGVAAWLNSFVDREPAICRGCAFNPAGAPPAALGEAEQWLRDGRLDAAEAGFRAIAGEARHAGALQGLGLVRLQRGDAAGALPWLRAAVALAPDARSGHNLATTLAALGRIDEAIATVERVVAAYPEYVPGQFALAGMLVGRDDRRAAASFAALCERAVPAQRFDLAEQCVARIETLPVAAEASLRLANLLRGAGRQDLALRLLQPILRDNPDDIAARLVSAMSHLAVVHATDDEIAARRTEYARALTSLDGLTATAARENLAAAVGQVGNAKPFLLAYQGKDDRALQQTYGRIVSRISRAARPAPAISPAADGGRLRVGFATAYFHLHSVSKLFGGWIRHLDRGRFEVFGYQLGADLDASAASLAACCAEYRHGTAGAAAWAERIAADRLHALIYPELGMHPLPVQLGCLRLAPVQCAAWGHPVTSGLPEIDYFLSSALMEPADAGRHYTEQLVLLPNLSIAYAALPDRGGVLAREALGLRADAVVYVCCQSLCKYLPRHDTVFARIAALVPAAQFLFIGSGTPAAALFRARLERCIAAAGLSMERHVRMVPPVSIEDFPALLRCADVYLDSIGWSGGNTTLEALACGLPVVTMPTGLMRGRHSAAILRHIGLGDRVAGNIDDFVARAVHLADAARRDSFRDVICASRHLLYGDLAPVRALEDFLAGAVARIRTSEPSAAQKRHGNGQRVFLASQDARYMPGPARHPNGGTLVNRWTPHPRRRTAHDDRADPR
ncbi:MAG TPA: Wzy polymerase domain-containing protein [Acetobacteraceae bacterium]|nr:Wzy polymerase domain-containing protein [Acetobacteraceae bacterium]